MLQSCKKYSLFLFAFFLLIATIFLFYLDFQNSRRVLTFAMLDIGQGDALFIESPTGTQVLIDSGPPRKILSQLARVMPPFDRYIDAIIITHPDLDHIGGFADVFKIYEVGAVLEPGTLTDSRAFQNLKTEIADKNIPNILAKKGMRIYIGGGAVIEVLFPDRDVFDWALNDGAIVAKLTYGTTSVMLTGDASIATEQIILSGNSHARLKSNVLKVGHHGSRTSTSADFVKAIAPEYAFIPVGRGNKFGHPHQDVLDTLAEFGVKIFRTDTMGMVIMASDGQNAVFSLRK
jgi:competence protein ComEC